MNNKKAIKKINSFQVNLKQKMINNRLVSKYKTKMKAEKKIKKKMMTMMNALFILQ